MVVRSLSTAGGLELYAHKLIEGLLARGIAVTVVCSEDSSSLDHPELRRVHFQPADKRAPKWQQMQHNFQAASLALQNCGRFDLVHSQHFPVSPAQVVTFHNHTVHRLSLVGAPWERSLNDLKLMLVPAYRLRDRYDRMLFTEASCRVFPARVCRDDFYATYAGTAIEQHTPYVVAHPGAALDLPAAAAARPDRSGGSSSNFKFLFVGRGYRKKGLDVLLRACELLVGQGREFELLVAGLRAKPLSRLRLKLMGLKDRVHYLGFRKDMHSVYAQARAFVMPSRVEPFGMAPLQAMNYGLVPIVSAVSGVCELLSDGENALILKNHLDGQELARLMAELIDRPDLLATLSKGGPGVVEQATWERTVQANLEAYRVALNRGQPGSGPATPGCAGAGR